MLSTNAPQQHKADIDVSGDLSDDLASVQCDLAEIIQLQRRRLLEEEGKLLLQHSNSDKINNNYNRNSDADRLNATASSSSSADAAPHAVLAPHHSAAAEGHTPEERHAWAAVSPPHRATAHNHSNHADNNNNNNNVSDGDSTSNNNDNNINNVYTDGFEAFLQPPRPLSAGAAGMVSSSPEYHLFLAQLQHQQRQHHEVLQRMARDHPEQMADYDNGSESDPNNNNKDAYRQARYNPVRQSSNSYANHDSGKQQRVVQRHRSPPLALMKRSFGLSPPPAARKSAHSQYDHTHHRDGDAPPGRDANTSPFISLSYGPHQQDEDEARAAHAHAHVHALEDAGGRWLGGTSVEDREVAAATAGATMPVAMDRNYTDANVQHANIQPAAHTQAPKGVDEGDDVGRKEFHSDKIPSPVEPFADVLDADRMLMMAAADNNNNTNNNVNNTTSNTISPQRRRHSSQLQLREATTSARRRHHAFHCGGGFNNNNNNYNNCSGGQHWKGPSSSLVPEGGTVTPRSMPAGSRRQPHARAAHPALHVVQMDARGRPVIADDHRMLRGLNDSVDDDVDFVIYQNEMNNANHKNSKQQQLISPKRKHANEHNTNTKSPAAARLPANHQNAKKKSQDKKQSTSSLLRDIFTMWAPPAQRPSYLHHHHPAGQQSARRNSRNNNNNNNINNHINNNDEAHQDHAVRGNDEKAVNASAEKDSNNNNSHTNSHNKSKGKRNSGSNNTAVSAAALPAFADSLVGAAIADLFPAIHSRQRQLHHKHNKNIKGGATSSSRRRSLVPIASCVDDGHHDGGAHRATADAEGDAAAHRTSDPPNADTSGATSYFYYDYGFVPGGGVRKGKC